MKKYKKPEMAAIAVELENVILEGSEPIEEPQKVNDIYTPSNIDLAPKSNNIIDDDDYGF